MPLFYTGTNNITSESGNNGPIIVTSVSKQMLPNVTYIANSSSRVYFVLPTQTKIGDQIRIRGLGEGGWRLVQNDGQMVMGSSSTTRGAEGFIESQNSSDTLAIECVVTNTDFRVIGAQGTRTIG